MIIKIYASEILYGIQEISVVFPTLKTRSDEKKNYQFQKSTSPSSQKTFSEFLNEAKEKEQPHNIHVYTSGYTKNALPFQNIIDQREYVHTN